MHNPDDYYVRLKPIICRIKNLDTDKVTVSRDITNTSGIYVVAFDYVRKTFGELYDQYGLLSQHASQNGAIYYTTADERYMGFPFNSDENGDLIDGDGAIYTSCIEIVSEVFNVSEKCFSSGSC